MQQTGTHAVEEIKNGPDDDPQQCQFRVVEKGKARSDATRDEVAAGQRVGDMFLDIHSEYKICLSV